MNKNIILLIAAFIAVSASPKPEWTDEEITRAWHTGQTLPMEVGMKYAPEKIAPENDNGMNVLVDVSHQCGFDYIWSLPRNLQNMGYRAIASQASVNTVLDPKGMSRIRIDYDSENRIYPFAWHPNFRYNLIITYQRQTGSPAYSTEEIKAMESFVKKGGALLILAQSQQNVPEDWSANDLAQVFGAKFAGDPQKANGSNYNSLELSPDWEITGRSEDGTAIQARRLYGKGRVAISGSPDDMVIARPARTDTEERAADIISRNEVREQYIAENLGWLCSGQKQYAGKYTPVKGWGGGGSIYPELETKLDGFAVYYAPNLSEELMTTVKDELPRVTEQILKWLPSQPTDEPMYLIMSAGNGGGWAINAFRPKENGIITLKPQGLISIYAHEFAHTLGGPANDRGVKAGRAAIPDQGEAHAGWFQGKIDAVYDDALKELPVKKCNEFYETDDFRTLDIKRYAGDSEYAASYGKGKDWRKIWVIWQKMDDTYGPTWYPRWKQIQYTRWADDPKRQLTWEETVEDMSIAVGEDLFPLFCALNTSLGREQMGEVEFGGKKINLSPTRIDPWAAPGKVRLEPIGNYKEPLAY